MNKGVQRKRFLPNAEVSVAGGKLTIRDSNDTVGRKEGKPKGRDLRKPVAGTFLDTDTMTNVFYWIAPILVYVRTTYSNSGTVYSTATRSYISYLETVITLLSLLRFCISCKSRSVTFCMLIDQKMGPYSLKGRGNVSVNWADNTFVGKVVNSSPILSPRHLTVHANYVPKVLDPIRHSSVVFILGLLRSE